MSVSATALAGVLSLRSSAKSTSALGSPASASLTSFSDPRRGARGWGGGKTIDRHTESEDDFVSASIVVSAFAAVFACCFGIALAIGKTSSVDLSEISAPRVVEYADSVIAPPNPSGAFSIQRGDGASHPLQVGAPRCVVNAW